MKLITLSFLIFLSNPLFAQLSKEQRLQDSVIGWDPKNYYDRNYKPQATAAGRQKETYLNKFAEWMKQSYTPVAGLGEYQRFVNAGNSSVLFSIWDVGYDYLDAQKHFRPIGETGYPRFYMATNMLAGTWNIDFMCKPDEWYFTMQPNGCRAQTPLESDAKMKGRDPHIAPNAYPYITWINDWDAVYLAPGNKLPIIPVSKGEFLQAALKRMDYLQDSLIQEDWKKESRKDEATKNNIISLRKKEIDRYRDNIGELLNKYNKQLSEPAMVANWQFTYHDIITGSWDVFHRGPNTMYYPVYKMDAATIRQITTDPKPAWVAILFPYQTKSDGNKSYEMYLSLTQHLNYEYIYNYFFDPAKVKDVDYKPLNEDKLKARLDAYRNKNNYNLKAVAAVAKEPGVHFREDFSGNSEGSEPAGWFYYKAGTKPFSVTTLAGEKGKWLKLGFGRAIKPSLLQAPLPANFLLEYDVATDKNYNGRTGGAATLTITNNALLPNNDVGRSPAGNGAIIEIRTEAGNEADYNNNNYRGILRVDIRNNPEQNEQNYSKGIRAEYALKEFTDKRSSVRIGVKVSDGQVYITVNGKTVIQPSDFKMTYGAPCKLCGVPQGLRFRDILFRNNTNDNNTVEVYIGNIKITGN